MNEKRSPGHTGAILAVAVLLFAFLLYVLNVRLGSGEGFEYASYFKTAFLVVSLLFVSGTLFGLTQLRNR